MTRAGSRAPAVTPMSHRIRADAPDEPSACLARRSLRSVSMALALLAAGCIVADPPNSTDPAKTPPLLMLGEADPPVVQVRQLWTSATPPQVQINVPVRSEDAGDRLAALLFVDWNAGSTDDARLAESVPVAPSTFDDTGRMISVTWDYSEQPPGCRQLTLLVTHLANYDWFHQTYFNPADVAIATWFFNIDDLGGTNTLSGCPRPAQ
jgi:hypothetical protein